ncbi:MAG: hypothetical protein HC887_04830 [Desulfobacteraceae bacterium]|nr:hypothetical protein [Desulfobacteraceae bacterium]
MKLLEHISKGDAVRFREEMWHVSGKDDYHVSAIYHETQWTLTNQQKDIVYLLRSREKINNEWQEFWIVTKEIPLADVQFQNADGVWESLNHADIPTEAPQSARYGQREYLFHAKNVGKAENDEGGKSTKITWDYLDESQKYNLAIELWKKRRKFYPEAYDGENVAQTEFEIMPYPPLRRIFPNNHLWIPIGIIMGSYRICVAVHITVRLFPVMERSYDSCSVADDLLYFSDMAHIFGRRNCLLYYFTYISRYFLDNRDRHFVGDIVYFPMGSQFSQAHGKRAGRISGMERCAADNVDLQFLYVFIVCTESA